MQKDSEEEAFGVCVNNEGMLKGVVLKYSNQDSENQHKGFGFSHICDTFSGFRFPTEYPQKKYFRDVIYSVGNSSFYFYDDKNKSVLALEWPENLQKVPKASDLDIKYIGELRGTVTFGNILKVSPSGRRLFGYEGGESIKVFGLGSDPSSD